MILITLAIILFIFTSLNLLYKRLKNKMYYPGMSRIFYKKPNKKIKDIWIPFSGGKLHAWYYDVPNKPVIFFCHGNAGNISNRGHYLTKMIKRNIPFSTIFD